MLTIRAIKWVFQGSLNTWAPSGEARRRYNTKTLAAGISVDPYTLEEDQWTMEQESIPLADVMGIHTKFLHEKNLLR